MTDQADAHGAEVQRLLAAAASTIAMARSCWLLTTTAGGSGHVRPMGRLQREVEADNWLIRLVADGRSRKAGEVRGAAAATALFQQGEDAFVALAGVPSLRQDASEARLLLKRSFDVYFPTAQDRDNAAVIEIDTRELELWIRGVTPEPFGLHPTRLERDPARSWRLVSPQS